MTAPQAQIISLSDYKRVTLNSLCREVLGFQPGNLVKDGTRSLSDPEKFNNELMLLRGHEHDTYAQTSLWGHSFASLSVIGFSEDILPILSLCSGMEFVIRETLFRDIFMVILSADLNKWQRVVVGGCHLDHGPMVRAGFNNIMKAFEAQSLGILWAGFRKRTEKDTTFILLEGKL